MTGSEAAPAGAPAPVPPPALAIVAGQPTAEETAAVVVVLTALTRQAQLRAGAGATRSLWSARSRLLRVPVTPGRGAWRGSALPG